MARNALLMGFLISAALGACAGRSGGTSTVCPGAGWCGPAAEAERMAEEVAGSTLNCPIHIEAAYATRDGGVLPAAVPAGAHGRFDERRSKRARDAVGSPTCCYDWVDPCPGG
jgi:hypothetical protein